MQLASVRVDELSERIAVASACPDEQVRGRHAIPPFAGLTADCPPLPGTDTARGANWAQPGRPISRWTTVYPRDGQLPSSPGPARSRQTPDPFRIQPTRHVGTPHVQCANRHPAYSGPTGRHATTPPRAGPCGHRHGAVDG